MTIELLHDHGGLRKATSHPGAGPLTSGSTYGYVLDRAVANRTFRSSDLGIDISSAPFDKIAPRLGYAWSGSRDPSRYQSFAEYFAAIRVMDRSSREVFGIKLGIEVHDVKDIENGVLPSEPLVRKFVRVFLRPDHSAKQVLAAFPQLQPDEFCLELRDRFLKFRHLPKDDPQRRSQENAIVEFCVPMAQRIANSVAWRYSRPDLAEEIWGEGLMLAVRDHDPRRGFLPGYLKARIRGLARAHMWSRMHAGKSAALRNFGLMVREADEFLLQDFGRDPSEAEIAQYLDIPVEVVQEVAQAVMASDVILTDNLDLLMQDVIDLSMTSRLWEESDNALIGRFRKLSEFDRELLYLFYFDAVSMEEIARMNGTTRNDIASALTLAVARLGAE